MNSIRIGTRQSQLALWQAHYVRDALISRNPGLDVELVGITSQGDKTLDVPLSEIGGKGLFLKELEEALLDERVDIAVHSMKDVTVTLPEGLHIPVICEREDPRDAFVSSRFESLEEMPEGAIVGSCSLRRQCFLRHYYPQLRVENLRGNVNTRLGRLDAGDYDALILASAGLKRLDMFQRIRGELSEACFLPAVGQGAVGIECRIDDEVVNQLLSPLNHADTSVCVLAERSVNECLEGGCHVPVAAYAIKQQDSLWLRARVGNPNGSLLLESELHGAPADAVQLGVQAAQDLLEQGAGDILRQVYANA